MIITVVFLSLNFSAERPLALRGVDGDLRDSNTYNRGTYMIVLPSGFNDIFLTNENYGGDFVAFKKTQGYDVHVVSVDDMSMAGSVITAQEVKDYIMNYYSTNPMLEYVLLIGDVNGSYTIPTFTIDSYNEEDIDVTDYPYTFDDDVYEPEFFVGRWSVRSPSDVINIKSRSIQYVTMDNISDTSYLNNFLLVAGNYKTAEGEEVPPSEWPVTPVWTSLWLMEELQDYGYTNIDTAFFHKGNWETGEYNPTIANSWNDGVGLINYRGWGDANGWHKPYFHKEEVEGLNNGWNLPVMLSFVCNTGDFGNDYSGTGLNKCFGEVMVTSGSPTNPKGAAAMVGPSDLDTDTRFNNVICGAMWDALLDHKTAELAPALHYGKHALVYEFDGLSAPDGTVIDEFYHHVYGVLGDPSLPVWLKEPGDINVAFTDESPSSDLYQSFVSLILTDSVTGEVLPGVVGALLDSSGELIGKSVSNSNGVLTVDFDTNTSSDLTLYFNAPQYKQSNMSLNYISDDGSDFSAIIPLDLDIDFELAALNQSPFGGYGTTADYFPSNYENIASYNLMEIRMTEDFLNDTPDTLSFSVTFTSTSDFIDEFVFTNPQGANYVYVNNFSLAPGEYIANIANPTNPGIGAFFVPVPGASSGNVVEIVVSFDSDTYEIEDKVLSLYVSSDQYSYLSSQPSPSCDYGYKAYDHTDIDFDEAPVYDWIEINQVGTNLNLTDDSVINDVQIGFDFNYFGNTYNSLTVSSNGWAPFEPCQLAHFWNFSIPNAMGPSGMLAPFMDDLDDNGGTVPLNVYAYNTGDGRFIVEWDHVLNGEDDQNCPVCIDETFQMILFDPAVYQTSTGDGEIVFQYKEIHDIDQNGNYSTIGIESPDQEDGVQYLFSGNADLGSYWTANNDGFFENIAIKFTTGSSSQCMQMDLTGDGYVNVNDVISVVNIIISQSNPTDGQLCSGDVDGNGVINVNDIIAIVNHIIS
ncbi:MAG: hypothetical protein CMG64_02245 [Candidatus Marinimicrobia bacterium]|nr:hypothetical protein [Candidatus Neomarinimicrobiota bacterium]